MTSSDSGNPGDTLLGVDALVGQTFADRYLIEERIGSGAMGAMGEVYRARHVKIGKSFAVKVLRAELLNNDKIRKRFDREAGLTNIVGIVDAGETFESRNTASIETGHSAVASANPESYFRL